MTRRIISILCYSVAGLFLTGVSVIAFYRTPSVFVKFVVMGTLFIPGFVSMLIGLAIGRFKRWKHTVSVVMFSVVTWTVFMVLAFVCVMSSKELDALLPQKQKALSQFNDYMIGFGCMLFFAVAGAVLFKTQKNL